MLSYLQAVTDYRIRKTIRLYMLKTKTHCAITFLRENRAALFAAAVTDRINLETAT